MEECVTGLVGDGAPILLEYIMFSWLMRVVIHVLFEDTTP